MNTKIIKLDLNKRLYEKIIAKQDDTRSRFLLFQLLDGALPFNLSNRSVRVYGAKPDGTTIFNDLTITHSATGFCLLELTNQMLAVAGIVKLELMITEGDKKLTTIPFELEVIKKINSNAAVESSNEFSSLLNALKEIDQWNREFADKSGKLEELYTPRLNELHEQLDNIVNESIPTLDKKRFKITRATKKIFDDATVVNINNTGKQAEICGFRSDSDLANYADRDSAVMYVDGTLPTCLILEVINFTADSVQVVGDTSSIEVGMIIDCMNQTELNPFNQATKFSGFVSEVNKQIIKVNGWYQLGNTSTGQIPNKNRVIINPVTKLWTMNNNIFLNADSFGWGGVIAEYGMFNRKSVSTGNENYRLSGIDLINYDGVCEVGYSMRNANTKATTKTKIGFKGDKALQNFRSTNADEVGYNSVGDLVGYNAQGANVGFKANVNDTNVAFKTENDRFNVNGFGKIKNLLLGNKVYGDNANILPYDAWIHFVGSGTHSLPLASNFPYANIKIIAKGDCTISGNMFTNTGDISTYSLGAWRTLELFSDGSKWYRIF